MPLKSPLQTADDEYLDELVWNGRVHTPLTSSSELVPDLGLFLASWVRSKPSRRSASKFWNAIHKCFLKCTLYAILSLVQECAPVPRQILAKLQISSDAERMQPFAAAMPNMHMLPGGDTQISMELKPKCGWLPTSRAIHPRHRIKWKVSRYKLHQHLKLQQVPFHPEQHQCAGLLSRESVDHPCD
jgi:Inositol-pentakisphosphate 2-kinase